MDAEIKFFKAGANGSTDPHFNIFIFKIIFLKFIGEMELLNVAQSAEGNLCRDR